MIVKAIAVMVMVYTSCVTGVDYTYDSLAGGWLKYHEKASWDDAYIRCDTEGAILASPINSQIRDGIKDYISRVAATVTTIHTGVKASFETGDYYSVERVDLNKMPVLIETGSVDYSSSESCVKWMTGKAEVRHNTCQEELPFVCFKKRKNLGIAGCATVDPEYKYNETSGSCYKLHTKAVTWTKAYNNCKKEGGYLAISNNQLEKRVLIALYDKYPSGVISDSKYNGVFMGLRKWENEPWVTVEGQTLEDSGFTGWSPGEPNNAGGKENCGVMFRNGDFNDDDCNDVTLAYICEKKPEILYT